MGRRSYGIYLWHYPVYLALGASPAADWRGLALVPAVALSVAIAAASYAIVERPLLRLKDRLHAAPDSGPAPMPPAASPAD